ncbi:MMPL family transporter [Streptomyces sp. NPDC049555]|uniref:MMPL family transporter n=1 Tax=unclassified Streptomyces TaxID=2593676 RepID=UPI00342CDCE8
MPRELHVLPETEGFAGTRRAGSALRQCARLACHRPRRLLVALTTASLLLSLLGAVVGTGFSPGGYDPAGADSVRADAYLDRHFHNGTPDVAILATSMARVDTPTTRQAGLRLTRTAAGLPGVSAVQSYWTTADPALRSHDGRTGLLLLHLSGGSKRIHDTAETVLPALDAVAGPLRLAATGTVPTERDAEQITKADLVRSELLAAPVVMVLLLVVYRSALAALLPVAIGAASVAVATAALRLLALVTPVSVFAQNITTALGFGLAVDYSLFLLSRYREETATGADPRRALTTTLVTAGHTVLVSATTVMLSACGLLVFPMYFLRSLGFASIAVVACATAFTLLAMPALLAVAGDRLTRTGRYLRRSPAKQEERWYRMAHAAMKRPFVVVATTTVLLLTLALPFAQAHFGRFDDRLLPPTARARQAGTQLRAQFPPQTADPISIALPHITAGPAGARVLDDYARRLSRIPGVTGIETATGSYRAGRHRADVLQPRMYTGPSGSWLRVIAGPGAKGSDPQLLMAKLRAVPIGRQAWVGGPHATLSDTKASITDRLPWALAILVGSVFAMMLPFVRSVLAPFKAVMLAGLSLTASFGSMVWIFQFGHLHWLLGDFPVTGSIDSNLPVLLLCVVFGLATDYELFILARIKERYEVTGDNNEAVAWGVARSGRLVTASALTIACVFAAMATSHMSQLKMVGFGTMLAVLLDATVVRIALLPALMSLASRWNWWWPWPGVQRARRVGDADQH